MIRDLNGTGQWLPGQVQSVPPGLVVDITFDASLAFGSTGTGYDAIAAGIKDAVLAAVDAAAGTLAVSALSAAAAGAPGVASVGSVVFNSDPTITSVPAPITTEAQYVRLTCRTIR